MRKELQVNRERSDRCREKEATGTERGHPVKVMKDGKKLLKDAERKCPQEVVKNGQDGQ